MKTRIQALEKIINEKLIDVVFQPIVSLKTGVVLGYEALSRTPLLDSFQNIEEVFSIAKDNGRLWDLERLCRMKTLEAAKTFMVAPFNRKLFLNVSPEIMNQSHFHQEMTEFFLNEFQILPHNIVFEVSEKNVIENLMGVQTTLSQYKTESTQLVMEEAKEKHTRLSKLSDFESNYIKIDMRLIRNIDKENLQRAIVKGLVEYSKTEDVFLIAEGIETPEELEAVIRLGVDFVQGYYIQKPQQDIIEINPDIINQIYATRALITQEENRAYESTPISNLYSVTKTITPDTLAIDAYEMINQDLNCVGLTIVENNQPLGIITKEKLAFKLSGRHGFTLYQNKPVSTIMDQDFLQVDGQTPVNIVAELAMERPWGQLYDFIVVTDDSGYLGTVTIKKMLKKATELELNSAREQSPLTGLPGNMAIDYKLTNLIKADNDFSVTYIDIDHFKAYNDVYGFKMGDMIIKLLGKVLRENISSNQFIGHIGGDDFIVILDYHIPSEKFDTVIQIFEEKVLQFYHPEDVQRGYIETKSRDGRVKKYPLISITVVSIHNRDNQYQSTNEISLELAKLKNEAKLHKENIAK